MGADCWESSQISLVFFAHLTHTRQQPPFKIPWPRTRLNHTKFLAKNNAGFFSGIYQFVDRSLQSVMIVQLVLQDASTVTWAGTGFVSTRKYRFDSDDNYVSCTLGLNMYVCMLMYRERKSSRNSTHFTVTSNQRNRRTPPRRHSSREFLGQGLPAWASRTPVLNIRTQIES